MTKRSKAAGSRVHRRDFLRVGAAFGMTSTLAAGALLSPGYSLSALANTAGRISEKRDASKAKHVFKLGMVYGDEQHDIQRVGVWDFVRDIEERTDGAILIDVVDSGGLCSETKCVQQAMQGVIDMGVSSTQNGASIAPWMNALDYPFMFQSAAQIYDFLYNPESEKVFRSVLRERHKVELLFSTAELRGILMGSTFKDKPELSQLADLKGARIRATGTQFGQTALGLLGMNPLPVAWAETPDAMRSGLVDGMETWGGAAAAFNMAPVVSQYLKLGFIPGTEATMIRTESLDKLEPELRDALMESAYQTQQVVMYGLASAQTEIIGDTENPGPDTIFGKSGTKVINPSDAMLEEARGLADPENEAYASLRGRLDKMAGFDAYEAIKPVAQRLDSSVQALDVVPRRWWL